MITYSPRKNNKPCVALLVAGATLALATLIDASSSSQVEQLGQMAVHRSAHKATALSDGRVLITGGRNTAGIVIADAEIFDPNTDESAAVGPMATARVDHTATLLKDGRVLITGGSNATGTLNSAEIFDPSTGTFTSVSGSMNMARAGHTATLLSSGKVLIAGGDVTPTLVDPNGTDVTGTAEMFDPSAATFGDLVLLQRSRTGQTATLFSNDTVWLAGGGDNTIESFDATAGAFTLSPATMSGARSGHEAFALSSSSMLFFGGDSGNTIDEFNPSADTLSLKTAMDGGAASSATLLANGTILVLRPDAAGVYAPGAADQGSAFTWFDEASLPGSTVLKRTGQSATELAGDKKILIAGGENAQHQPTLQIASFNPARIWTDKDDYMPDDPVFLFGSGWKPNENVYLYAVDSETEQWTYESTVAADVKGSFALEPYFIVQLRQLGTMFTVDAVGAQSNMQAEVEFTDAVNFNSISVGSQNGTALAGTPASVTYQLTGSYTGNGANNDDPVTLSFLGWTGGTPAGVTANISPTSITAASPTSTLTLQTSASSTVAGTFTFTVRGTTKGGQTKDGTGTLTILPGAATKIALSGSTANLGSGATRTLTATIQDANGNTVTSGPNSSLSVAFAKTTGTGSVTGLGAVNASSGVASIIVTGGQLGSITIAASGGGLAQGTGNPITFSVVAGAANKLSLSGSTADLAAGITRTLTATIQDVNGNTVTTGADSTLSVTFSKTAGTGTVTGLGSATASGGVATITVTGNAPGSITITATATGSGGALTAGTGNPISFNVLTGAANKIALTGSTANLTAGTTRQLTATIQDSMGNTVTTGADSTLSVTFAKTAGAGNVSGLTSVGAVAGVANLTVTGTTAGTVSIGASATGSAGPITSVTPITFTVVASTTVDHFSFATITSPQTAGTAFNVTITAQDAGNNTVVGYSGNGFKVKLTSTGALVGAPVTTPAFTNGVLTNQSVTITNTGNFTITATDNGGGSATGTSNPFQVDPGAAAKLAFIQQPTNTTAGQTITPAVTVQIQDANGNMTTSTASVAMAIGTNPSSGTLSGTTPVAAVNGVATFSNLSINKGGTGYTFQATSTGLTSATSLVFTINNPAPTLTSINPTSGNLNDTLDVVFNGSNYIQGVTTVSFGANITVNTVTVNSSIKLTANITIASNAVVGQRNVSVTNAAPGGGTATLTNAFTVNNPATTTVVTSSSVANTSTYGDSVTFTATVSTASGTPTGSVTFYDSANCSGSILAGPTNLDANGKASFTTTVLSAPGHTITGCYTPTGIYLASNGSVTQTVNKAHLTITADDKSKTYDGHLFTAFTSQITGFVNGQTSSVVSGTAAYTGDATGATDAGTYTITPTQGTLTAANYDFTVFKNGTLTINKADATWTTNDASKIYGDDDPSPLTTGSGTGFASSDNVTATYTRAPGETVAGGPYHITAHLSPASVATNYNITNAGADFTITKRNATWTTNPNSKTYGAADPVPLTTGSGSGFLFSDSVTATYSRDLGETVAGSPYYITATLSPSSVLGNYNITNNGANFTIEKKDASVTPNAASKTYGSADPAFTGTLVGFLAADGVTATYSRTSGETVAGSPYTISAVLAPAAVLGNYNITYNTAEFTIERKDASVTPNPASKTYGDADPAFTGTLSGFLVADGVTAIYSRIAGEMVGGSPYTIGAVLAPAGVLGNYKVTYNTAEFTIDKRNATWTTNPNSKTYGDLDPAPLTTGSGANFVDGVTATYSRDPGETVAGGPYHITATLSSTPASALDNYNVTNSGADFTINKRSATWTTNPNSKIYGEADPNPITAGSGSNFVAADNVTATYSRVAGETVLGGPYHITATLSPAGVLGNYDITNTGANFTINVRPATWVTSDNAKTYGDADPNPLTTGGAVAPGPGTGFLAADNVTATYTRVAGETVLGAPYHITANLAPVGVLSNYTITNDGANFTINTRPATWTTNPSSKTYGDMDPNPLTTGSGNNFVATDHVTATYSRGAGETVLGGPYHITANLGPAAVLSNYSITNSGAAFTINPRPATVQADNKSKTYGDDNPMLTAAVSGTINSDVLDYSLSTVAVKFSDVGNYPITVTLGSNPNYNITPINGTLTINKANQTITWTNPATIVIGTPLSSTQLNATVAGVAGGSAPGALTYTPPAGTVLGAGANQALKVDAAATINYNPASKTVYINVQYIFVGFLQPIDNLPTLNSAKAGQTIPIKWQLKDAAGNLISDLGTLAPNGLTSGAVTCGAAAVDVVEELSAPGSTVFRFDGTQFIYNWQTSKPWAGGCRTLQVKLSDGTSHYAQFTFK